MAVPAHDGEPRDQPDHLEGPSTHAIQHAEALPASGADGDQGDRGEDDRGRDAPVRHIVGRVACRRDLTRPDPVSLA